MANDLNRKIDEILDIVQTERTLNNTRFSQLTTRMDGLTGHSDKLTARMDELVVGMSELRFEVGRLKTDLKQDIDKVYTTLTEDLQVFATSIDKIDKRVTKLERKAG